MYSVLLAPWQFGHALFSVFFLVAGGGLLAYAFGFGRKRPTPMHPAVAGLMGGSFAAAVVLGTYQDVVNTCDCMRALKVGRASAVSGTIESVRPIGQFGSQYYELKIGDIVYVSAGLGVRSECGFKQSYAQALPPQVGTKVTGKAVGSRIVEARHLR